MENSLKQTYERNNEQGVKHTRSTPGSSALVDQYNKDEHERVEYAKKSAAEEAKKAEKAKDKDDGDKGGGNQGGNQGGPATPATPEPAKPKLNQKKEVEIDFSEPDKINDFNNRREESEIVEKLREEGKGNS